MPPRPIGAPTTDAYERLLALITRGDLAPGARITEPMIAERLGLSRTPVRAALQRLQIEGLLVNDGGGARPRLAVSPLDPDEARAVYQSTGLLEGAGARVVAGWPNADRAELAAMLKAADGAFRAATRAAPPNPAALFSRHRAFHRCLVDATATTVSQSLLRSLEPRLTRFEWFHGPLLQLAGLPFTPTYGEHQAVIDAVRRGTAVAIEKAIRSNWSNAAERLVRVIRSAQAVVGGG